MRFFVKDYRPLRQLRPETGESFAICFKHSQLPNIIILLYFLVHFLIILKSIELIFDYIEDFYGLRGEFICEKVLAIEAATA